MKIKNKKLILIVTIFISMSLILFLQVPLHKQIIPTKFTGSDAMGFDLGPGNINFGPVVPNGKVERNITITNIYNHATVTNIKSSGPISSYIIVSENNFILQPDESKTLIFSLSGTQDIQIGKEYPGEIIIITKRKLF